MKYLDQINELFKYLNNNNGNLPEANDDIFDFINSERFIHELSEVIKQLNLKKNSTPDDLQLDIPNEMKNELFTNMNAFFIGEALAHEKFTNNNFNELANEIKKELLHKLKARLTAQRLEVTEEYLLEGATEEIDIENRVTMSLYVSEEEYKEIKEECEALGVIPEYRLHNLKPGQLHIHSEHGSPDNMFLGPSSDVNGQGGTLLMMQCYADTKRASQILEMIEDKNSNEHQNTRVISLEKPESLAQTILDTGYVLFAESRENKQIPSNENDGVYIDDSESETESESMYISDTESEAEAESMYISDTESETESIYISDTESESNEQQFINEHEWGLDFSSQIQDEPTQQSEQTHFQTDTFSTEPQLEPVQQYFAPKRHTTPRPTDTANKFVVTTKDGMSPLEERSSFTTDTGEILYLQRSKSEERLYVGKDKNFSFEAHQNLLDQKRKKKQQKSIKERIYSFFKKKPVKKETTTQAPSTTVADLSKLTKTLNSRKAPKSQKNNNRSRQIQRETSRGVRF